MAAEEEVEVEEEHPPPPETPESPERWSRSSQRPGRSDTRVPTRGSVREGVH